jgi:hypothetical protein
LTNIMREAVIDLIEERDRRIAELQANRDDLFRTVCMLVQQAGGRIEIAPETILDFDESQVLASCVSPVTDKMILTLKKRGEIE